MKPKILALNASIQASMAGEAGRGFSVVAVAVQSLAERAANATKQIEVLVRTIQTDTNEAVVSMERSTTDVVGGALLAENAGAALEEIEQVSNQIASLVQNISGSARQQTGAAQNIARNMQVLKEISAQTAESTNATSAAIAKLAELSSGHYNLQWPTWQSVPLVVAATILLGFVLALPSRRLSGDYLAIVMLFFLQIFNNFTTNGYAWNWLGRTGPHDVTGGPTGITNVEPFRVFGHVLNNRPTDYVFVSAAGITVVAILFHYVNRSRTGRAWRALREDPLAAEMMGIPVKWLSLLAVAVGAGVAGFAVHGVRAGLGLRLLHPATLLNLLAWPVALPFWLAVRFAGWV